MMEQTENPNSAQGEERQHHIVFVFQYFIESKEGAFPANRGDAIHSCHERTNERQWIPAQRDLVKDGGIKREETQQEARNGEEDSPTVALPHIDVEREEHNESKLMSSHAHPGQYTDNQAFNRLPDRDFLIEDNPISGEHNK